MYTEDRAKIKGRAYAIKKFLRKFGDFKNFFAPDSIEHIFF